MARAPAPFRPSDVTRAVRAVIAAGMKVGKVEFEVTKFTIYSETSVPDDPANDLEKWMAGRAR